MNQWCIPGDSKPLWVLMFEDPEKGMCTFSDENEAHSFFERANQNWNCWLLYPVRRKP